MKNLQNKTKMAIIVIAMLLVSGQLVFGVKWKNIVGTNEYIAEDNYTLIY